RPWAQVPSASEAAYITFRYARSLATGFGLVFNPGERVFGFSSPLWTVWCALGYLVTHDPVIWTRLTTLAGDVVTLVLFAALLRRQASLASAWCFAFFYSVLPYFTAVGPYFTAVGLSGMENSALLTLIVVAAVLCARGSAFSGPALAAVGLIRPGGLAAAAGTPPPARWR